MTLSSPRPSRRRGGGRGRSDAGDARRRLVLLERGGADPRRRRRHRRRGHRAARARPRGRQRVGGADARSDAVSWHAGVLLVLALTLIGGFFWFERSRPPAQIVALVGALAAISVAGRIALSPVPNVVPSTDIVLIAGYALGGAPGLAGGALTGLISNFWLGQGPWTPWQMAGWGMTGLLGAWLAAATGGRVGRFGLAAVCALAGLAYGAL